VGPHCSFCGTSTGPFREVEGLFTVLLCVGGQAARSGRSPELLAHHGPGEPWYKWGCPLAGCDLRVLLPWDLEAHAAADHPG
jgi:hypothetical protein